MSCLSNRIATHCDRQWPHCIKAHDEACKKGEGFLYVLVKATELCPEKKVHIGKFGQAINLIKRLSDHNTGMCDPNKSVCSSSWIPIAVISSKHYKTLEKNFKNLIKNNYSELLDSKAVKSEYNINGKSRNELFLLPSYDMLEFILEELLLKTIDKNDPTIDYYKQSNIISVRNYKSIAEEEGFTISFIDLKLNNKKNATLTPRRNTQFNIIDNNNTNNPIPKIDTNNILKNLKDGKIEKILIKAPNKNFFTISYCKKDKIYKTKININIKISNSKEYNKLVKEFLLKNGKINKYPLTNYTWFKPLNANYYYHYLACLHRDYGPKKLYDDNGIKKEKILIKGFEKDKNNNIKWVLEKNKPTKNHLQLSGIEEINGSAYIKGPIELLENHT
jgi:hypothetical protein